MVIGIVAEGATDRAVLEAIILGVRAAIDEQLDFTPLQPPPEAGAHAGWGLVFDWLRRERYREAFRFIDLLVIHVDTDVCDEQGFGVSRRDGTRDLDDLELVAQVVNRLARDIDPAFLADHGEKIVFAIAVNEIECWLLPLYFEGERAERKMRCFDKLRDELQRRNLGGLKKEFSAYEKVAKDFRKRKTVDAACKRSPSLGAFVADLDAKGRRAPLASPTAG